MPSYDNDTVDKLENDNHCDNNDFMTEEHGNGTKLTIENYNQHIIDSANKQKDEDEQNHAYSNELTRRMDCRGTITLTAQV